MLSRTVNRFLQHTISNLTFKYRISSSAVISELDVVAMRKRDPAPYFFDKEVQQLLMVLTRPKDEIVFRDRRDEKYYNPPQYKFMTDEELQAAREAANVRVKKILQMPPVVQRRTEIDKTLEIETALQGYDKCNYVFTDISLGIGNKNRLIVVREPSGRLRLATWNERHRMNCIYFSTKGREMTMPKMFSNENLKDILEREEYIFILDRACIQFEPDDPTYQNVVTTVYEHVNAKKHYDRLRSTRHFGPMVFHLVWNNMADELLADILRSERIDEAILLIRLFCKIHLTDDQQRWIFKDAHDDVQTIKCYCKHYAIKQQQIEESLRMYLAARKKNEQVRAGITKAHGMVKS